MNYLSLCSGIEAATVAWHPLGWQPAAFSEIEKFPSAVLAHHYPTVPNLGDMTKFTDWPSLTDEKNNQSIDLLVGGTPCQSFSVAGLRKGLADPRGNLMLTYLAIARKYRPRWLVWENVPGVLSSNGGRDFGTFLGGLAECGYGFAYRVLDAQYFGLAQRRRRVFVVGHSGGCWQRAAAVLLERESLRGDSAPSREAGEAASAIVSSGPPGSRRDDEVSLVPTLTRHHGRMNGTDEAFVLQAGHTKSNGLGVSTAVAMTVEAASHSGDKGDGGVNTTMVAEVAPCLTGNYGKQPDNSDTNAGPMLATVGMAVRRLSPVECERLQGFPDGYTDIRQRGKPTPDGPRYKALGNSMAVPCMAWIGKRIAAVDKIHASATLDALSE